MQEMNATFLNALVKAMETIPEVEQPAVYDVILSYVRAKAETYDGVAKPVKAAKTTKKATAKKAEAPVIKQEVVEKAVKEAMVEVEAPTIIPLPKEEETDEEVFARREAFVTLHGAKTLKEVFGDAELSKFIEPEKGQIRDFIEVVYEHYKDEFDEFDEETAEEIVNRFIASADETVEDCLDITIDKFFHVFHPFMCKMYYLISGYTEADLVDLIDKVTSGVYHDEGSLALNYANIAPIYASIVALEEQQ